MPTMTKTFLALLLTSSLGAAWPDGSVWAQSVRPAAPGAGNTAAPPATAGGLSLIHISEPTRPY